MELKRITRSKSFEMINGYGLKSWDKFGLEADLSPNEDPIQLYKELDKMIMEAHKESNQTISFVADNVPVPEKQIDKPQKTMIEEMEACDNYSCIQSFRFTVKNDAEKLVYETKLNELSPKN